MVMRSLFRWNSASGLVLACERMMMLVVIPSQEWVAARVGMDGGSALWSSNGDRPVVVAWELGSVCLVASVVVVFYFKWWLK